ncbi:penicillin-binding protein 2 [candidate division WWE3 bacterium]|nr:penicillin-binding protein 2 [candidate division WWE3 bacterium]
MKHKSSEIFSNHFADHIERASRGGLARRGSISSLSEGWKDGLSGLSTLLPGSCNVSAVKMVLLGAVLFCAVLVLVGRLFYLQIIKGDEYYARSERNRYYTKTILPDRGVITDRTGEVLARNAPAFSLGFVFSELPKEKQDSLKELLRTQVGLSDDQINEAFTYAEARPYSETIIKNNITYDQQIALQARMSEFPGVDIVKDAVREYPQGEYFSTVLGYTGSITKDELNSSDSFEYTLGSIIGKIGAENKYEEYLRGKVGHAVVEVEANGKVNQQAALKEPESGNSLTLTIDAKAQKKIGDILKKAIEKYSATAGSIVISDPNNGEVFVMLSLPTFDNNVFFKEPGKVSSIFTDPRGLLINRAISGLYAPGSTVKPAIGASVLQKGIVTSTMKISGEPQVIKVGQWEFPDWTKAWGKPPHGMMDLPEAIAKSSDIFFYKIGGGYPPDCTASTCEIHGLGSEGVPQSLRDFGFGKPVGIDLPAEAEGLVPDPEWKQKVRNEDWFLGNTYHLSIGQGDLLATPIQVLNLTNIVATDGSIPYLHIAKNDDLLRANGFTGHRDKPVSLENIQVVRHGMELGPTETGIVYSLRGAKVPVAAKTGTAEFGTLNAKGQYETHAWVTGFAPVQNPQISFVVMLESGGASSNAADVAREIIDWWFGGRPE